MTHPAFEHVIGHDAICAYFSRILENQEHAHAYLFTGPEQIGKTLLAKLILAEMLETPINQLEVSGVYQEVNPEGSIKIDQVRALQQHFSHSAFHGSKKAALILEAHRMTTGAQNALLKTLEEPAGDSILLLTSSQPDRLLPTIRSRCHMMHMQPAPREVLCAALQKELPEAEAHLLASLSAGRQGLATQLKDTEVREQYLTHRQVAQDILIASKPEQFMKCSALAKSEHRKEILQQMLFLLHDLALSAHGNHTQIMNADLEDFMIQLTQIKEENHWSKALAQWLAMQEALDRNVSPALALESLALTL